MEKLSLVLSIFLFLLFLLINFFLDLGDLDFQLKGGIVGISLATPMWMRLAHQVSLHEVWGQHECTSGDEQGLKKREEN